MQNQDLRFRRRVVTVGEQQPKNKLMVILAIAIAAIIVPALAYTVMHPAAVTSTVQQIARHMPVKEMHVAVFATRSTPTPRPTPTATAAATPTPAAKATAASAAELAHLAHLKRAHALAAAAASASHARKLASTGQTSDVSTTGNTSGASTNGGSGAASTTSSSSGATPATLAAAPEQQPVADATPLYAPDIVVDARFRREVQPDYPELARMQNAQGTAVVLATIGPDGNVLSERIDQSTGNKQLDAAALAAARMSSFEPPQINGKPATETYRLVYTFIP